MKKLNLDKIKLEYLYDYKKMSIIQISKIFKCSQGSISVYLKQYNIKSRKFSREGLLPWNKNKKIQTNTGKTHFKKGHVSWNKDKKTGIIPKSAFKKGIKSDRKGKTWEEIYSKETIDYMRKRDRESAILMLQKNMNKCDTSIEKKIENYLLFNEILYIKQYKYKLGIADFWLPETNTIIECDGDYWHSLPGYEERDLKQNEYLEINDYNVLRFKEYDIINNFHKIEKQLFAVI